MGFNRFVKVSTNTVFFFYTKTLRIIFVKITFFFKPWKCYSEKSQDVIEYLRNNLVNEFKFDEATRRTPSKDKLLSDVLINDNMAKIKIVEESRRIPRKYFRHIGNYLKYCLVTICFLK